MKKVSRLFVLLAASLLFLVACGGSSFNDSAEDSGSDASTEESTAEESQSSDGEVFTISAIPDFDATELNRAFSDFADYMSEELGIEVEYSESVDYAAVVSGFERGDIDLAWFGGLTGVQAMNAVEDAEALAQRPQDAQFQSVFIKNMESSPDVNSLEDVAGHSFTFGSESSTSGHLMPRYFLNEAGLTPEEDFQGQVNYSGSHDTTMELVQTGSYELGVVNMQYWDDAVANGDVDESQVQEFYRSPEYYDYNWTINAVDEKFGPGTKEAVRELLLNLTPEDTDMMELLDAEEFIETENSNYEMIAQVAREIGIIE